MIVIPPDVDLLPENVPPGFHARVLQSLLEDLPRALIGEAIAAELPPETKLVVEVSTRMWGDAPRAEIEFTFGHELVELRGRVLHVDGNFRLHVEPSYSMPMLRG